MQPTRSTSARLRAQRLRRDNTRTPRSEWFWRYFSLAGRKCRFSQNRKKVLRLAKSPTARKSNEPHLFAKTRKFQNTPNPYFPPNQPRYGLPSDVPSGRSRTPPPREGCRWAWLGAPPDMPFDSRAVAEASGGGQKDSVTWERHGRPAGRQAGHTFHESILIGNLRLQTSAV